MRYLMPLEQAAAKKTTTSLSPTVISPDEQTIKSQMQAVFLASLFSNSTATTTRSTPGPETATSFEKGQDQEVMPSSSLKVVAPALSAMQTTTTTDYDQSQYLLPWPDLVFQCGWHANLLASFVFPNVTCQEYKGFVSLQQLPASRRPAANANASVAGPALATLPPPPSSPPPPVLVVGMHGPCELHEPTRKTNATFQATPKKKMWLHVNRYFPGKALFVNGESFGDARRTGHNTYQVGTIQRRDDSDDSDKRSLSDFYYMAVAFLERAKTKPQLQAAFFDPAQKPKNKRGARGVIYVASNCVQYRQEAADRISDIDPENLPVYYGGQCRGKRATVAAAAAAMRMIAINNAATAVKDKKADDDKDAEQKLATTNSKLLPVPKKLKGRREYQENSKSFRQYRYCLVMENTAKSGYITEKIVYAFLGGCVPIYYGTREVFDVFNKNAFIFYDVQHPELALEKIRYMEMENRSAYDEMLNSQPILANGTDTIERYFSLRDDIGGGKLIRRIRAMLGYNPNPPTPSTT
jgi:Glycosyltransferase family 10 (fucosyltransferase) C-term